MMVNGTSNTALGVSYLVNGVSFLKRYRRLNDDLPSSDALRYVAMVLFFCVLVHAGDILAFYRPNLPVFTAVALLAAVVAPAAVSGFPVPRRVHGLTTRQGTVRWGDPTRTSALVRTPTETESERERYERLRARVLELEDTVRRNVWLQQSRIAVSQLNAMLDNSPLERDGGPAAEATKVRLK